MCFLYKQFSQPCQKPFSHSLDPFPKRKQTNLSPVCHKQVYSKSLYTALLILTWFISSTTLKGHLLSSCRAIRYNIVETLFSPPLWWYGVNSWSSVLLWNLTLMRIPYLSYSSYKSQYLWNSVSLYYSSFNKDMQITGNLCEMFYRGLGTIRVQLISIY